MKLFGKNAGLLRSDEIGFIHEFIACRINAMIEVLNLPVEMLCDADPDSIRNKLLELSDEKEFWHTPEAQMEWLEDVLYRICDNDEMIERVTNLTRKKFETFISIPETV